MKSSIDILLDISLIIIIYEISENIMPLGIKYVAKLVENKILMKDILGLDDKDSFLKTLCLIVL